MFINPSNNENNRQQHQGRWHRTPQNWHRLCLGTNT